MWDLLLYFPLFVLGCFIAFFIPGNILISQLHLTKLSKFTLSISFGIVLWALQGFLLGYLHIRWFTYIYLLATTALWLNHNRDKIVLPKVSLAMTKAKSLFLYFFVGLILLTQLLTTFSNGIETPK